MDLLIKPLDQKVIQCDPLYKPQKVYVLDELDEDLNFKKQLFISSREHDGVLGFLDYLIETGKVKSRSGWVPVHAESFDTWTDVWPEAVRKLANS